MSADNLITNFDSLARVYGVQAYNEHGERTLTDDEIIKLILPYYLEVDPVCQLAMCISLAGFRRANEFYVKIQEFINEQKGNKQMNYYLHNVGYDKPINFRRIVLEAYKSRCMWLRDDYLDHLGLYDYTKWLPDMSYEESNLKLSKERYKECKLELAALSKVKLQEMYEEELKKYEVMHNSDNSYHADFAAKARRSAEEYRTHLDKWLAIPDTPNWLAGDLIDIYDTAIKDAEDVERMHSKTPPTFKKFADKELKRLKKSISFHAYRIKSAKRTIKEIEKRREEVKQIFAWLDQIDGGATNETLD